MSDFSAAKDIDKNEATGLDIRLLPENLVELVGLLPSTTAPDEESDDCVDNDLNWSKDFLRPDVLQLIQRTPTYEKFKFCGRLLAQARSCIYYMKHQPNDQQSDLYKAKTKDLIICLSKAARMSSLKWFRVHIYSHRVVHDTVREWLTMALSGSCQDTTRVYDCIFITSRHFMLASSRAQDLNEQAVLFAIALKFLDACIQVDEASNASDGSLYLLKACYLQTGEHTDADVVLLSKRALELNEQVNFEAHYLIGSAYGQSQQQRHAAIPHFERLLNLAPTGYWNTHLTAITLSWMLVEKYIHEGGLDTREFLIIAEHFPQYPEEALRYYKHGVAVGHLHDAYNGCCDTFMKQVLRLANEHIFVLFINGLIAERPINPFVCNYAHCENDYCWKGLFCCSRCKCRSYCCKACQKQDWKRGHKEECAGMVVNAQVD